MVREELDGRTKCGIFIQRPGTTYFHISWKVFCHGTADTSYHKDRNTTVRDSLGQFDQPPPYEPVKFKELWVDRGSGVWCRKLEHYNLTQWGISTHEQVDKSSGPDSNPNLTFTCEGMLRQPKHSTEATKRPAQSLVILADYAAQFQTPNRRMYSLPERNDSN